MHAAIPEECTVQTINKNTTAETVTYWIYRITENDLATLLIID